MRMQKVLIVFAVVGLVALAGCSMTDSQPSPTPTQTSDSVDKQALLQDAVATHTNAQTVKMHTTLMLDYKMTRENSTKNFSQYAKQDVTTVLNKTTGEYHTNGTSTTKMKNTTQTQKVNTYYVNGKIYTKVDGQWRVQNATVNRSSTFDYQNFTTDEAMQHFNVTYDDDAGEYVYRADLRNNETLNALFKGDSPLQSSSYAQFRKYADEFSLELRVDKETRTLSSVKLELHAKVDSEELAEQQNTSDSETPNMTIQMDYIVKQEFVSYNESEPITPPANATA